MFVVKPFCGWGNLKHQGLQRQCREWGVDWKRIWATRDNAREGTLVGIRAASFGTWLTANDQGAVEQVAFHTDDAEVCKSSFARHFGHYSDLATYNIYIYIPGLPNGSQNGTP